MKSPILDRSDSRRSSSRTALSLAVSLACVLTVGCYGRSSGSSNVVFETEFNGDEASANFIGFVAPGDDYVIEGDIGFGADFYDGFAFIADHPGEVEFVLTAHDAFSVLAVHVWDPVIGAFIFSFDAGQNPQIGAFDVYSYDTEFHLVVEPLFGAADYTLSVHGNAFFPGPAPQAATSNGRFGSDAEAPNAAALERLAEYGGQPVVRSSASQSRLREVPVGQLLIVDENGQTEVRQVTAIGG